MWLHGPDGLGVTLKVVERLSDSHVQSGDFALDISVYGHDFTFTARHLWVEHDQFAAFVAEFDELARTRTGQAALHFMSPHVLEVLAINGTSNLVVRGRIENGIYAGGTRLPIALDFNSLLDSEQVELARADLNALLRN